MCTLDTNDSKVVFKNENIGKEKTLFLFLKMFREKSVNQSTFSSISSIINIIFIVISNLRENKNRKEY